MSSREAFEKALSDRYPPEHFMRFDHDGEYVEPSTRHQWEGWQAALKRDGLSGEYMLPDDDLIYIKEYWNQDQNETAMADAMKPTKIAFETRYSDDSGVEHAVRFDSGNFDNEIEFESINQISFPASKIGWLIECLELIKDIIEE